MWLTQQLQQEKQTPVTSGEVTANAQLTIQGESVSAPQMLLPYGMAVVPPAGYQAVLVNGLCTGVTSVQDARLNAGEVRLFSSGGAEIWLKNDGTVIINGKVFDAR